MLCQKILITSIRSYKRLSLLKQLCYPLVLEASVIRNCFTLHHKSNAVKPAVVAYHTGKQLKSRSKPAVQHTIEMSSDELLSFGESLLVNLNRKQMLDDELDNRMNQLSGILYQFLIRQDEEKLVTFFSMIDNKELLNEACYTILMRHYADLQNLKKVQEIFNDLKNHNDIEMHARSYVPLIIACLRCREFNLAAVCLQELVGNMKIKDKDQILQDVLNTCTEIRNSQSEEFLKNFVRKIFSMLEKYSTNDLKPKTVDAVHLWFKSDPSCTWKIESTVFNENTGVCNSCAMSLKLAEIPYDGLVNMKRSLMTLIKASIVRKHTTRITDVRLLKTNINIKHNIQSKSKYFEYYDIFTMEAKSGSNTVTTKKPIDIDDEYSDDDLSKPLFSKLDQLKVYLTDTGPYDVVIDALNVGYAKHGFNPLQVRDLVKYFVDQDLKILILCAGILKKELLAADEVPPANQRVKQLMMYLQDKCNLFFVGSSVVDDYYMLYTLIHHHFDIQLVSRDLFRDHLYHLNAECTANFQRFQQANQHILRTVKSDGTPIFKMKLVERWQCESQKSEVLIFEWGLKL